MPCMLKCLCCCATGIPVACLAICGGSGGVQQEGVWIVVPPSDSVTGAWDVGCADR